MEENTLPSSTHLIKEPPGKGAGRCVSFAGGGNGPEDITSDTEVQVTLFTDDETADENTDERTCYRKVLFLLAAFFLLPVIRVFATVAPTAVRAMDVELGVWASGERLSLEDKPKLQNVLDTYNKVHHLFGILSGILIAVCNYRVAAILGCCISGTACLVASFLPVNKYIMVFLLGVLPGIGNNLVTVSVTVAILEYFHRQRLLVLSFTTASVFFGTIVYFFIEEFLFPEVGVRDRSSYLQYQAATYVLAIGGAILLTPLNLRFKEVPRESVRIRMFNVTASGLERLKSPVFYVLAAVFLFDSLGRTVPRHFFGYISPKVMGPVYRLAAFLTSPLLGCMIAGCLSRKTFSLRLYLILITVFGLVMGALTLGVTLILEPPDVDIVYGVLYGALIGLRIPLMTLAIPSVLGEDHLSISVGFINFATGVGVLCGTEGAGAISESGWHVHVLYMSGIAFIVSGIASVILTQLANKKLSKTCVSEDNRQEPGVVKKIKEPDTHEDEVTLSTESEV